jgi:hypothetical protein
MDLDDDDKELFKIYLRNNVADFHAIPVRLEDEEDDFNIGGRVGEKLTLFTPSVWFMDDSGDQTEAIPLMVELSERVT